MIPFSPGAYAQMQQDVARLTLLREEVMGRLKVAREMGDLSENGAYQYAKFELGNIGRQLRQLNFLLKDGEARERPLSPTKVEYGCLVTLKSDRGEITYDMVSEFESSPTEHRLSLRSPLGLAIVGQSVGAVIEFSAPVGKITYTIVKIVGR
jgi:transcription elongation factor GreA